MITATLKIGTNKGRRRIWIEGARLAAAGFQPGMHYQCEVSAGAIDMVLNPAHPGRTRKVSGKAGKPIVDLLGKDVETAFPTGSHVEVKFHPQGMIFVRPAQDHSLALAA